MVLHRFPEIHASNDYARSFLHLFESVRVNGGQFGMIPFDRIGRIAGQPARLCAPLRILTEARLKTDLVSVAVRIHEGHGGAATKNILLDARGPGHADASNDDYAVEDRDTAARGHDPSPM
jgi:hypothetical protein